MTHIIKSGDTLYSLAKQYNTTIDNIVKYNNRIVKNPSSTSVLVNKTNSLPYNYVPSNLTVPNVLFSFEGSNPKKQLVPQAATALTKMFSDAKTAGIPLVAVSGYRSFDTQAQIFANNIKNDLKANEYSARPGESEHQTGLAMDVTSPSVNNDLTESFANTREGKWLQENAPNYGFIIRYPQGKENITGYQYEPWHLRYVGVPIAKEISKKNITLEEYIRG